MMNFFAENIEEINKMKPDIPNEPSNVRHTRIKERTCKKNAKL